LSRSWGLSALETGQETTNEAANVLTSSKVRGSFRELC
jgi:hypothetical protein